MQRACRLPPQLQYKNDNFFYADFRVHCNLDGWHTRCLALVVDRRSTTSGRAAAVAHWPLHTQIAGWCWIHPVSKPNYFSLSSGGTTISQKWLIPGCMDISIWLFLCLSPVGFRFIHPATQGLYCCLAVSRWLDFDEKWEPTEWATADFFSHWVKCPSLRLDWWAGGFYQVYSLSQSPNCESKFYCWLSILWGSGDWAQT